MATDDGKTGTSEGLGQKGKAAGAADDKEKGGPSGTAEAGVNKTVVKTAAGRRDEQHKLAEVADASSGSWAVGMTALPEATELVEAVGGEVPSEDGNCCELHASSEACTGTLSYGTVGSLGSHSSDQEVWGEKVAAASRLQATMRAKAAHEVVMAVARALQRKMETAGHCAKRIQVHWRLWSARCRANQANDGVHAQRIFHDQLRRGARRRTAIVLIQAGARRWLVRLTVVKAMVSRMLLEQGRSGATALYGWLRGGGWDMFSSRRRDEARGQQVPELQSEPGWLVAAEHQLAAGAWSEGGQSALMSYASEQPAWLAAAKGAGPGYRPTRSGGRQRAAKRKANKVRHGNACGQIEATMMEAEDTKAGSTEAETAGTEEGRVWTTPTGFASWRERSLKRAERMRLNGGSSGSGLGQVLAGTPPDGFASWRERSLKRAEQLIEWQRTRPSARRRAAAAERAAGAVD